MKKLDRYILSQFMLSLIGSLALMIGLYIITLYIDDLKYFSHPDVSFVLIIKYIFNKIPEIFLQVLPAASLFSTSYIFGVMNSSNEIIALYNGRISFTRIIAPLGIAGIFLAFFSFFFFEFVAADSSNKAFEVRSLIKKQTGKSLGYMYSNSKYFVRGKDDTVYYIEVFDSDNNVMHRPVFFKFNAEGMLKFQLTADRGAYDQTNGTWNFIDAKIIKFDEKNNYVEENLAEYTASLPETPKSFMKTPKNVMQMRYGEALKFIDEKKQKGGNYKEHLVEFHWRFAFPLSVLITILIGSIGGIYFRKAVLVLSFLLAVLMSFGYYGILALGIAFGKSGKIHPVIAAWMANVIYSIAGMIALRLKRQG